VKGILIAAGVAALVAATTAIAGSSAVPTKTPGKLIVGFDVIALTLFLEVRRRRGIVGAPVPPPPPGTVEGTPSARPGLYRGERL
jgi:hypothetical protein